jgi:hypothetical protein
VGDSAVKDDLVEMYVVIEGTESYTATLGPDRAVHKFAVNIIKATSPLVKPTQSD